MIGRAAFFFTFIMKTVKIPDRNLLFSEYNRLYSARVMAVKELEELFSKTLLVLSSNPRVMGRVKSFESYFKKIIRHNKPRNEFAKVSDLIGIRVVCPFLEDLSSVEDIFKKNFCITEVERKGGDHTYREFGYESIHLMILIPSEIALKYDLPSDETVEVQIRTILQDAWAEVEHELIYKAEFTPFDDPLRRKLAAINASLSLADIIFQEIRSYQQELNGELGKRRSTFFRKIEESTDAVLLNTNTEEPEQTLPVEVEMDCPPTEYKSSPNVSIDDLLLEALSAHNNRNFPEAIAIYTHILELKPSEHIRSLIHQHRGMAYFDRSHYEQAILDFSESQKLDPKSYKASYYEGIVCSVLSRYTDAIKCFDKSLGINPYQPYCLFRRGQAYYHLEDFPQALADCEAALSLEQLDAIVKFKDLIVAKLAM